jgi:3-deoxy-D-manno-octulosonic-acid transferase
MLWLFYNILFAAGFLALLPRFLWRMKRRGGYLRHFLQRFGLYEKSLAQALGSGRIWIHAVSVGEVFVALRFMEEVRRRRPEAQFVLSVTTSTSHALADGKRAAGDLLIYFPLDFPFIVRGALRAICPRALVLVECELWPNLIRQARRRGIPVVLINGRVSAHSYAGYRKLRIFTRPLLALVDLLCVQGEEDRSRLADLGADPARIHVMGTAKYDDRPAAGGGGRDRAAGLLAAAGVDPARTVLLGGSTWAGEEEVLLDLYRDLRVRFPGLFLVLAPRHAERAPQVLGVIESRGLTVRRRTRLADRPAGGPPDVLLVDTTGELRDFYAAAAIIFVGKSLTRHGGQNIIEPACFGKAVIVGPNMENFSSVMPDFLGAGAILQVADAAGLRNAVEELLSNPARREALGRRALDVVQARSGVAARTADRLVPVLFGGGSRV